MDGTINFALLLFAVLIALPALVLSLELVLSLLPRKATALPPPHLPRTTVLIPAHNEALSLPETLACLNEQVFDGCDILVVADNCTDETARIARAAGANVLVREDRQRKAKGFALEAGIEHLRPDPPEVVLIVDADCLVAPDTLTALASMAHSKGAAVQSKYTMHPHESGGVMQQVSAFAFLVNTHHRLLGAMRLGLPVRLNGTGMAFPWSIISTARLGNDNLVEDFKLGVDLVLKGQAIDYLPDAEVISQFPASRAAEKTQRSRWEHGHLDLLRKTAPQLIAKAVRHGDFRALGYALDLAIPPLTLLLGLLFLTLATTAGAAFLGAFVLPFSIALVSFAAFALPLLAVWLRDGRTVLRPTALVHLPAYIFSKTGIYSNYWRAKDKPWIRTERR